jgi:hypothetical protein
MPEIEEVPFLEDLPEETGDAVVGEETKDAAVDLLKKAKEFGVLNEEKRTLKARLAVVEAEMKAIDAQIQEKMIFECPNIKIQVGVNAKGKPVFKTVYVKSTLWAGHLGDKEDEDAGLAMKTKLLEALKAAGLEDFVSEGFNAQTLSAYVRAFDPDGKMDLEELKVLLPEPIQPYIKLSKVTQVAVKS